MKRLLVAVTACLVVAFSSGAWVRLHTDAGLVMAWPASKLPLTFVINDQGSADVLDDSEEHDLRRAFAAWQDLTTSSLAFKEVTAPAQRKRTDWEADDIHLVLFDDDGGAGFFPPGSGILAVTPIQFLPSEGRILDADVLFNDATFPFSTTLQAGTFDIRAVATHEIGHLLGLNHSQVVGSTMAPFTTSGTFAPRTLSPDDAAGCADLYPSTSDLLGGIKGSVTRAGQKLDGAHVWARAADDGRVVAGTFSVDGQYTLRGLPPGAYTLLAAPVDEPFDPGQIYNSPGGAGVPDGFETGFGPVALGPVVVPGVGLVTAPVLATAPDVTARLHTPTTSIGVRRGATTVVSLGVDAANQIVSAVVPGGAVDVTQLQVLAGVQVRLTLEVADDAPLGLYDIELQVAGGGLTIGCGLLEVLSPEMEVTSIAPACTTTSGGSIVALLGEHLDAVVELHVDGQGVVPASVDPGGTSLTFVAPQRSAGVSKVTVVDVSGDQRQILLEYVDAVAPQLDTVFPASASAGGGLPIVLRGDGLDGDVVVDIGGSVVEPYSVAADRLELLAPVLPVGVHDVRVSSSQCADLGDVLAGAFTALDAPDPTLFGVDPIYVDRAGGQELIVTGVQFDFDSKVELFIDPDTGEGGTAALTDVLFTNKLRVTAPEGPLPVGPADLLVRRGDGAVAVLSDGFQVVPVLGNGRRLQGALPGSEVAGGVVGFVDGLAGTRVDIAAVRRGKSDLEPALYVLSPGFQVIGATDAGTFGEFPPAKAKVTPRSARILGLVLPTTGRYLVIAYAAKGAGDTRLSVREVFDPSSKRLRLTSKDDVVLGPAEWTTTIDVQADALVSGTLRGRKKDGLLPTLEITGPDDELVLAVDGAGNISGEPDAVEAVDRLAGGRTLRLRRLPLTRFGAHTFTLGAAEATSGVVTGTLTFRPPRIRETYLEGQ